MVLHGHQVSELAALHLNARKSLVVVLVAVELQDLRDAKAGASKLAVLHAVPPS